MCKLSIIVPVFNGENYISSCLDSILKQTNYDYEVIIVNDGSTDRTEEIIDLYCKRYKFISKFNQENKGVSVARNVGISKSQGEWIVFLDADDILSNKACEIIAHYEKENTEIMFFDIVSINNRDIIEKNIGNNVNLQTYKKEDRENLIKHIMWYRNDEATSEMKYLKNACGKAYKKSFIEKNKIQFPEKVKNGEDMIFNIYAIKNLNIGMYINFPIYYYYQNFDSVTHRYKPDIDDITKKFYFELKKVLEDIPNFQEEYNLNIINNFFIEMTHFLFHLDNPIKEKERFIEFRKRVSASFYKEAFNNISFVNSKRLFNIKIIVILALLRIKIYSLVYVIFEMNFVLKKYRLLRKKRK